MKGLLKFAMLAFAFAFAGTAFAQAPAPKNFSTTPQGSGQEQQVKYDLYIFANSGDGQSGVAAKLVSQVVAKIKTVPSVNVIEGKAAQGNETATEFHFLTVETGNTTGALAVTVVQHVKGFDDQVYIGSFIVPVATDTVDDLTEGIYNTLGTVFTQIQLNPPSVNTTQSAPASSAPATPTTPNTKLSGSARS